MTEHPSYDRLFYETLRIRLAEEEIARIYPSDKIQSPVHLSIGQEHISVGICAALERQDLVFGTYRSHALYLAKGGSMNGLMAELFGKRTGCGKGKAGSMHLVAPEVGMMGASAIVAATIPHAVGAAMAAKVRRTNQIVVCFYGEGATGEGVYHESLNFASIMQLPIIFVCENNGLSIFTRSKDIMSFDITEHAAAYGIQTRCIDNGMDLDLIADTAKELVDCVRGTPQPIVFEIKTYRYRQHVGPNEDYDIGYRSIDELQTWQALDPLIQDMDRVARFTREIQAEIAEAIEFAENSEFPNKNDLLEDLR
nr:thiamine pyrophosphate-dependent dehydrogenase E1 component subunit alpha [uncultured Desulfobacter sp.]